MFEKVLIAEDADSISISVRKALGDLEVKNLAYASYCDYAITQIKKALQVSEPFELLITDLSFDEDENVQKINDGATLIQTAKDLQPSLKVLVFSVTNKYSVANQLKKDLDIDGYVPKGRGDYQDLKDAIEMISQNRKYISRRLERDEYEDTFDFTSRDIEIISLVAEGEPLKNIPFYLEQKNIIYGLSSVEKRLAAIKLALNFSSNIQLISYCRDKKII